MNSELFEMNKFNVLEDENYYYVYRALNKADHADALNHFYETKQDIEKIRTDRERYEEEHGKAKYFLAPSGQNYKDAVKYKKEKKLKIKIIEVKNIKDAINKLEGLK